MEERAGQRWQSQEGLDTGVRIEDAGTGGSVTGLYTVCAEPFWHSREFSAMVCNFLKAITACNLAMFSQPVT